MTTITSSSRLLCLSDFITPRTDFINIQFKHSVVCSEKLTSKRKKEIKPAKKKFSEDYGNRFSILAVILVEDQDDHFSAQQFHTTARTSSLMLV